MTRKAAVLVLLLLATASGCDSKIGTPFAVTAAPDLRERFLSECGKRVDRSQLAGRDPANTILDVGSKGATGSVTLVFDAGTNAIRWVFVDAGDYRWFLQFVREVVLPMLKPAQQRFVTEKILNKPHDELDIVRESRADGDILYHLNHASRDMADVTLMIQVHRH